MSNLLLDVSMARACIIDCGAADEPSSPPPQAPSENKITAPADPRRRAVAQLRRAQTPQPGVVLVGTEASVTQLLPGLAALDAPPRLLGCVLSEPAPVPLTVLGGFTDLDALVARQDVGEVIVCLPAEMDLEARRLTTRLDRLGVAWRFVPMLADQLAGVAPPPRVKGPAPRPRPRLDAARLIDRLPRPLDDEAIGRTLRGKRVLITGAGGSIGSELAARVAAYEPAELILVERSENALFEIDRQAARAFPGVPRRALMHDVTHRGATRRLVHQARPHVVFHAAAHKHVPVMEGHPAEAVENNLYGTRSIADAAHAAGCERFVMISSDKAVNPSSVMGATKRLAELYIQRLNRRSRTCFCMVRFGNVLGSACSLIPIWTEQLESGGPLTVTHPEMTRYFMTLPEAAGLVLQAGAYTGADAGPGGEVFLLDMGDPIRILDLAYRFLDLHGLAPGRDIEIQITGPRPGEKLFEELAYGGEDMAPTPHDSIRIWRTRSFSDAHTDRVLATFDRLRGGPDDLAQCWRDTPAAAVTDALRTLLPEMVTAAA